jgi:DNA repair photolyase
MVLESGIARMEMLGKWSRMKLTSPNLIGFSGRVKEGVHFQGRGAPSNPGNRFEKLYFEADPDVVSEEPSPPGMQFLRDKTASILAHNDSPDVGFDTSINPYRGCEHGCIYCYARPSHEFLGLSAGLDFESKILVKEEAPVLLRKELSSPKWKPRVIAMSGVTDCYQPVEKRLKLTRGCLEVLAECRNPVVIITKNFLVTRDVDLLQELARYHAVSVCLSITTLDPELARVMEPRTSSPRQRLAAIETLADAGVPVGVNVAPVIPGLTDHEMLSIIQTSVDAGAKFAGYTVVRLPYAVKDLFEQWLTIHAPGSKDKILNRIRAVRDGKLNVAEWGQRMRGEGIFADQISQTFSVACRKAGLSGIDRHDLSAASLRRPQCPQLALEL